jgi:cyclic beta-1,2-glucan synthetase
MPQVHVLSNGRYSVLVTSAGSGYSRYALRLSKGWREVDLTRWRADATLDDWGTWIYVKDQDSGDLWSAGYQPTASPSASRDVIFYAHQARFWRRDHGICVRTEITVPPEDDVEIRRITLTNHSDRPRRLMLTSYGEVVLAPHAADRRHQAFNKLFVESEHLPELDALLFRRRPRSAEEAPIYLAHTLVMEQGSETPSAHEGDRARFLGRGGTLRSPAALSFPPHAGGGNRGGAFWHHRRYPGSDHGSRQRDRVGAARGDADRLRYSGGRVAPGSARLGPPLSGVAQDRAGL